MRSSVLLRGSLLLFPVLVLAACTDDESTFVPPASAAGGSSQAGSGGSGGSSAGSGGAGQGGDAGAAGDAGSGGTAGAGAGGSDAGSGGSDAGQGGDAGTAGAAGQGGDAGAAGAGGGATCLPADAHAKVLTLQASSPLCVTRVHKTPLASFGFSFSASWGRHGGPLSTDTSSGAEVRRWQLPADAQGAMTSEAPVQVKIDGLPEKIFFGPALDMPFQDWTLITYTGSFPDVAGEVIAMNGGLTEVKARNPVNGWFAAAAFPGGGKARVLFTALSPVLLAPGDTSDNGLYFAEPCDGAAILKAGCGASGKLGGWESNSGPVAMDAAGHLFVSMSTFGGNQQVRGFLPAQAAGSAPVEGTTLLTDTDFSTSLAALGDGAQGGLLVVQASDSTTFGAKAAQLFSYTASEGTMSTAALADGGFVAKAAGASPTVFSSGDGRLWVATDGEDGAYFVALERK